MLFTKDKSFYKNLLALALPISLQNLLTFAVGLADNLMIGRLGDAAVAGVYMGSQIQTLLQIFSVGTEGAILVISAQYWGKGDTESVRKTVTVGLWASLFFGTLVTAVCAAAPEFIVSLFTNEAQTVASGSEYLAILAFSFVFFCLTQSLISAMRSVEYPSIGLYVSAVSLAVNLLLNYALIFGNLGAPALGVRGAAIATLCARITEAAVTVIYVFWRDKRLSLRFKELLKIDKTLVRDFFRYGSPIIAGQLVWAVNNLASSAIMGRVADRGAVTGLSIASTLGNLSYVVMNGASGAVGIITGKTVGAGKERLMREYAKTVQIIFLGLGILTGGVIFLLKNPFISLYNISGEAATLAKDFLTVLSVITVGTSYQAACLFGLVKSGGDIAFVFKNDMFFVFLIVIPSALLALHLGAPAPIVFAALKCDQLLKCLVAVVKINKFNWMKNLTRGKKQHN